MTDVFFFTDPLFLTHIYPQEHPENEHRLQAILRRLEQSEIWSELKKPSFNKASTDQLKLAHGSDYIDTLTQLPPQYLDSDTYLGPSSFDCAALASGALISSVDATINDGIIRSFSALRPPGHHAEYDQAMGFCLVNHVAVAACYAQTKGFDRVMIIDFDVHHGNGTQHIFENDPSVLYLSSHQYPFFPGTGGRQELGFGEGEGATINWPLPTGTDGTLLIDLYNNELPRIVDRFKPDIVFVSAGYDIHQDDPLGGFNVSTSDIERLVSVILTHTEGLPVHFSLEGGYNRGALAESVYVTLKAPLL